mmetsp:Transcript_1065/g.1492  ORF Transcript_1065/g.1492 Transcript_1065/m.1492 type:complete len:225 (+) Transcript_1065:565-1239(+)
MGLPSRLGSSTSALTFPPSDCRGALPSQSLTPTTFFSWTGPRYPVVGGEGLSFLINDMTFNTLDFVLVDDDGVLWGVPSVGQGDAGDGGATLDGSGATRLIGVLQRFSGSSEPSIMQSKEYLLVNFALDDFDRRPAQSSSSLSSWSATNESRYLLLLVPPSLLLDREVGVDADIELLRLPGLGSSDIFRTKPMNSGPLLAQEPPALPPAKLERRGVLLLITVLC